ncbi:STAS domain-containing protein [Staphylospora marina]|uniref:STAS domain-containing protein n=1 Tax=Staphylospora marina TaxID=2490858 RepID=UPI000F5B8AB2|nr:STAS domain-containing protein [Staphylospora marina]
MNLTLRETIDKDQTFILHVAGEVDVYTAPALREKLLPRCTGDRKVVVDLSGTTYIDSTGLTVLIGAWKSQKGSGGKLVVTGLNDRLRRLFQITRLEDHIEIEERVQEDGQS